MPNLNDPWSSTPFPTESTTPTIDDPWAVQEPSTPSLPGGRFQEEWEQLIEENKRLALGDEDTRSGWQAAGSALGRGFGNVLQMGQSAAEAGLRLHSGYQRKLADILPGYPTMPAEHAEALADIRQEQRRETGLHSEASRPVYHRTHDVWERFAEQPVRTTMETILEQGPTTAAAATPLGMAGLAAGIGSEQAMIAREEGATPLEQLAHGSITGMGTAALERLPFSKRVTDFINARSLGPSVASSISKTLTGLGVTAITESTEEQLEVPLEHMSRYLTYAQDKGLDTDAIRREMAEARLLGLLGGIGTDAVRRTAHGAVGQSGEIVRQMQQKADTTKRGMERHAEKNPPAGLDAPRISQEEIAANQVFFTQEEIGSQEDYDAIEKQSSFRIFWDRWVRGHFEQSGAHKDKRTRKDKYLRRASHGFKEEAGEQTNRLAATEFTLNQLAAQTQRDIDQHVESSYETKAEREAAAEGLASLVLDYSSGKDVDLPPAVLRSAEDMRAKGQDLIYGLFKQMPESAFAKVISQLAGEKSGDDMYIPKEYAEFAKTQLGDEKSAISQSKYIQGADKEKVLAGLDRQLQGEGRYLHRSFAASKDAHYLDKVRRDSPELWNSGVDWVMERDFYTKDGGIKPRFQNHTPDQLRAKAEQTISTMIKRISPDATSDGSKVLKDFERMIQPVAPGILIEKKQLPKQIRELAGEDRSLNAFVTGMNKVAAMSTSYELYRRALQEGQGEWIQNQQMSANRSLQPIKDTGIDEMDALLAPESIVKAFTDGAYSSQLGMRAEGNAIRNWMAWARRSAKANVTIHQVSSQMKQISSNLGYSAMSASLPLEGLATKYQDVARLVAIGTGLSKDVASQEDRAVIEGWLRDGLLQPGADLGDVKRAEAWADRIGLRSKLTGTRPGKAYSKVSEKAANAWQTSDGIMRVLTYSSQLAQMREVFEPRGWSEEQIHKEAVRRTLRYAQNFRWLPEWTTLIRDYTPYAPFTSFRMGVLQNISNIAVDSARDIREGRHSSNPALVRLGLQRLGALAGSTAISGVSKLTMLGAAVAAGGMVATPEEEEAADTISAPWDRFRVKAVWRDKAGDMYSQAASYIDVKEELMGAIAAAVDTGMRDDHSVGDLMQQSLAAVFSDYLDEDLDFNMYGDLVIRGGQTKQGSKVWNSADPALTKIWKGMKHASKVAIPGTLTKAWEVRKSLGSEVGEMLEPAPKIVRQLWEAGNDYEDEEKSLIATSSSFFGMPIREIGQTQWLELAARGYAADHRDNYKAMREAIEDAGKRGNPEGSQERIQGLWEYSLDRSYKTGRGLVNYVDGFIAVNGGNEALAAKHLKEGDVSKADIPQIIDAAMNRPMAPETKKWKDPAQRFNAMKRKSRQRLKGAFARHRDSAKEVKKAEESLVKSRYLKPHVVYGIKEGLDIYWKLEANEMQRLVDAARYFGVTDSWVRAQMALDGVPTADINRLLDRGETP